MSDCIEFSSVIPLSEMSGDSGADTDLLNNMAEEAKAFIQAFDWCKGIRDVYFGAGVGGVVGVFFFRIFPGSESVDEFLWVVVGDIPPAFLVTDKSRTPSEALQTYISEMREWVAAAESGQSVDALIPVNVIATREMGLDLKRRLNFLENEVLPSWR